ncbi:MAG TPA: hypothetical protein VE954_27515 [Oligoflexus sp.]|uniref:hypothetical protein n=1 Tax=Oligoflexus sp. TaxID=1971216 RepID=UPI002D61E67E|nr:hypothetical protein [Oligoflexus sp.]HYX36874.1 hypothetical protein [Oligoflexus sp.]
MSFDPKKLAKHAKLDDVEQELFTPDEIRDIKAAAAERSRIRRHLSDQVSKALAGYMTQEDIGFNELERRLQMSSATTAKLLRGESNITLDTVAAVAYLLGQEPKLTFEHRKVKSSAVKG